MKHLIIITLAFAGLTVISASSSMAGCDKEIVDADLQVAAPLTETEIRVLLAEAEAGVVVPVEPPQTASR